MKRKALFLDRDGVIVKPIKGEAPQEKEDLEIIPQSISLIHHFKGLGFLIFVVSNQPDIALGKINESKKKALEIKFKTLLAEKDIQADAIYYCYHHPQGSNPKYTKECSCKKPKPGMIISAARKFNIDLNCSWIIGDRASDIKAGETAKLKTIFYDTGINQDSHFKKLKVKPDYKIKDLSEVKDIIKENSPLAFILAAGKGERMMPLTKVTPKPLLKISRIPMMEYLIRLVKFHGFLNIGINLFYLSQKIKNKFGNGKKFGVNISYIQEDKLTGSAGGVKAIASHIRPTQPFFVISSDMMINFDLSKIYKFHNDKKSFATLCCYFRTKDKLATGKSGLVLFDKKTKLIKKFLEKPKKDEKIISQWVYSSIAVLDPEILKYIPDNINGSPIVDLAKDILPKLLKLKKRLYAYPINRKKYYQLGIDTPERIKLAEEDIRQGKFIPKGF